MEIAELKHEPVSRLITSRPVGPGPPGARLEGESNLPFRAGYA